MGAIYTIGGLAGQILNDYILKLHYVFITNVQTEFQKG